MLLDNIQWRKDYNIGKYKREDFPDFEKLNTYEYCGYNKLGHPIFYHDPSVLYPKTFNHDRFNKYFYTCVEEVMSKMHGNVERFVCIMDMKNLSYKNVDLMLGQTNIKTLEKNYPETIHKFYIINNHWLAIQIVKLFKPIIPKRTFSKLEFLGRDEEKNLEIMMKDIDINVIPKNCGGNNIKIF